MWCLGFVCICDHLVSLFFSIEELAELGEQAPSCQFLFLTQQNVPAANVCRKKTDKRPPALVFLCMSPFNKSLDALDLQVCEEALLALKTVLWKGNTFPHQQRNMSAETYPNTCAKGAN
ncbi:unnamed protein product [Caretta caretta]